MLCDGYIAQYPVSVSPAVVDGGYCHHTRVIMGDKNAEKGFILEFIEVYRSLPALWDVKCKDYCNRSKKGEQYEVLIEKYRENYPDAEKQDVIKKINSLRTNFRKELNVLAKTDCTILLHVCGHYCAIYCTTFNNAFTLYNILHNPKYCTILLPV